MAEVCRVRLWTENAANRFQHEKKKNGMVKSTRKMAKWRNGSEVKWDEENRNELKTNLQASNHSYWSSFHVVFVLFASSVSYFVFSFSFYRLFYVRISSNIFLSFVLMIFFVLICFLTYTQRRLPFCTCVSLSIDRIARQSTVSIWMRWTDDAFELQLPMHRYFSVFWTIGKLYWK